MEVYLSRNHQTCLHLFPLSVSQFQDVFNQPSGPDGQPPHLVIERFISPVEALDRNLKGLVIQDLSGLSQLNALVESVERMSERDLQIFSGALDMERIGSPADALRIVKDLDQYELFPHIKTDEDLGRFLVDTSPITGKFSFSEAARPYLDYAKIGAEQRTALGGAYTQYGFVKRQEKAPAQEETPYTMVLTLMRVDHGDTLILPASEEQLEDTKENLETEDLDLALITSVKYREALFDQLIPVKGITVEDANELALCLQQFKKDSEEKTYCAALEAEAPSTFSEAVNIAMDLDDYERITDSAEEYARQALRGLGADEEILDTIDGYTDFDQLGRAMMAEDGVRRTEFGLVRRVSCPFPAQEAGQTMC